MLTREENRWNFKFLKFFSSWNFLPISINEKSGRISRQEKKYKLGIWYFLYILEGLHLAYGFIRFVQLVLSPNVNQMMDQVFIHSIIVPCFVVLFWSFQLFIKRPKDSVMLFNQLFDHEKNKNANANAQPGPRKIFTWDLKYNRHELITLSIPFAISAPIWFLIPILLSDPDRMWILYSVVPAESKFKNLATFLLLTAVDLYFFSRIVATTIFSFLNQLLFFQKCDLTFYSFQHGFGWNSIELPRVRTVEKLLKEMQSNFLYVHFFNRVYAYTIFTWKQLALFYGIFTAFFAIRYNFEYPLTSIFAAYVHLAVMFCYALMYERAFTIPENWRKVKGRVRVSANLSTIKEYNVTGKAGQFQKEIQRIPEIGVKVGDFHMLERKSTPDFISFVISCVASLLIFFR